VGCQRNISSTPQLKRKVRGRDTWAPMQLMQVPDVEHLYGKVKDTNFSEKREDRRVSCPQRSTHCCNSTQWRRYIAQEWSILARSTTKYNKTRSLSIFWRVPEDHCRARSTSARNPSGLHPREAQHSTWKPPRALSRIQ
jgi:hypothetical protein